MQRALLPLLAAVVLSTGCYSVKLYSQENLSAPTSDSHMRIANSFFWGLVATNRIDLDRACGPAGYKTVRSQIGMVFQNVALIPTRTVLENAAFGLEVQGIPAAERRRIATDALSRVGLGDWLDRYPRELSGGMQQRVGLARAIAADPEIILMDEPFSALDPLIRRQLQDEFRALTKSLGKSAVFITHDLDEAIRIGDRIAIMKDGAMIQVGTAEEIVMNPADQYVADFVAGISRIHLVKAGSVMMPPADFTDAPTAALEQTGLDADIDALIHLVLASPHGAVAVSQDGDLRGVVTARTLLEGLKGDHAPVTGAA